VPDVVSGLPLGITSRGHPAASQARDLSSPKR